MWEDMIDELIKSLRKAYDHISAISRIQFKKDDKLSKSELNTIDTCKKSLNTSITKLEACKKLK